MKKLLQVSIYTCLFFILQSSSCSKTNDKKNIDCTNNTILLPQLAKDLFIFNKGSWWVYKNISTNELDSMHVEYVSKNTSNYFRNFGGYLDKCYEDNGINLVSNKIGNINWGISVSTPDGIKKFEETNFQITTYTDLKQDGYYKLFFKGDSIIQSPQIGSNIIFTDSITVQNNLYSNVMIHLIGPNNIDFYEEAIYSRKIGLIRFKRSDNGSEWELIKYNINQ